MVLRDIPQTQRSAWTSRRTPGNRARDAGYVPGRSLLLGGLGSRGEWIWNADWMLGNTQLLQPLSFAPTGAVPKAVGMLFATDGAGLSWPEGTATVIGGVALRPFLSVVQLVEAATDLGAKSDSFGWTQNTAAVVTPQRRTFGRTLFVRGLAAGASGAIRVYRYGNYKQDIFGDPQVTIETISVDGANGEEQIIELDDLVLPDDIVTSFPLVYYAIDSWTGDLPALMALCRSPTTICTALAVPKTLHEDFTASDDPGISNRCMSLGQCSGPPVGYLEPFLGELGTMLLPFARIWANDGQRSNYDRAAAFVCALGRQFAQADTARDPISSNRTIEFSIESGRLPIAKPRIFVGNSLREAGYYPIAPASFCFGATITESAAGSDESVSVEAITPDVDVGPGWRNIRLWCHSRVIDGDVTAYTITVRWRVDGGAWTDTDVTALTGDTEIGDWIDIPGPMVPASRGFARLDMAVAIDATFGPEGGVVEANYAVLCSPILDVPSLWTVPGADGNTVPGGYLAGALADPTAIGGVLHVPVGDQSASWTITPAAPGIQTRVISFVPPTNGLWRIDNPGVASGTAALGEYEHRRQAVKAHLGRANKRFYGMVRTSSWGNVNGTWTLAAETITRHSVPSSGITITSSLLSPAGQGYFFGEIAVPAAGTYRIWTRSTWGANGFWIRSRLSIADALCLESVLSDAAIDIPARPTSLTATSATAPPGSPSTGATYWIVPVATGIWSGLEGHLARWDGGQWDYVRMADQPRMTCTLDGVGSLWTGTEWVPLSTVDLTAQEIVVDAAATLYVVLQSPNEDLGLVAPGPLSLVSLGWDAV